MSGDTEHPISSEGLDQAEAEPPATDGIPGAREFTTVPVDVEAVLPEVRRLKAVGAVLFLVSGISALLPALMLGGGGFDVRTVAGLALAAAGVSVGVAGLASPRLRRPSLPLAPVLLIAAAGAGSPGISLDSIPPLEILLAFTYGLSLLLAVEHLHAVMRFVDLGAYVARQRLTSFHLPNVVAHFQIYGLALAGLVALVTAFVVVGVPWVLGQGSNEVLGRSVELRSVFGVAIAAAVVFTLSALILVFIRSVLPQRVEVERVAYSRDRMEEMLRSGDLLEAGSEAPGRR